MTTSGHTWHVESANPPEFPGYFDQALRTDGGDGAYFGRNVLQGLVDGIGLHREQQARSRWTWGVGVVGCAMTTDGEDLLEELSRCESSCIVVTKQEQRRYGKDAFRRLEEHAANAQGIAQSAFRELADLAPTLNGKPLVVGPGSPMNDGGVPAVREIGFRRGSNRGSDCGAHRSEAPQPAEASRRAVTGRLRDKASVRGTWRSQHGQGQRTQRNHGALHLEGGRRPSSPHLRHRVRRTGRRTAAGTRPRGPLSGARTPPSPRTGNHRQGCGHRLHGARSLVTVRAHWVRRMCRSPRGELA